MDWLRQSIAVYFVVLESYIMVHSAAYRQCHTHTLSSACLHLELRCQLTNQLKSSCSNEWREDHINTAIDFVWGGLHDGWITLYIANRLLKRRRRIGHTDTYMRAHTHTGSHTKTRLSNVSGAAMIHLSKHSRGSVRSGSQHSADRCLSLCGQTGHTPVKSTQTLL